MKKKYQIFKLNNLKFKIQMSLISLKFFFYNYQRKNLKIFKFFDQRRIGAIPRIFISSFMVVMFFYMTPIFINYGNENLFSQKEFKNDSKAILAYTLNKKNNGSNSDNELLNEEDLLFDIFSLNDLETDTVRLNASTIKQLFEDTDYKLDDVRQKKIS